ncbi:aminotransferase class I/II-fold pyridoxal phosphate-dependent enzyme [Flavobacterium sp.]|uniref:pyridoxal phosphate-dependent decarboxylase family protein n=1 Tax=Flavobacterium sp. TaxID=239 RepID=UPI0025C6A423|nr:aminotransferase class I/II-fold pyridoxal phosphate-dependent enzyme [Flavobacterium sp.]MBA4153539.1 aspartate aminotransferase family protein [Flavobacterium sp.]
MNYWKKLTATERIARIQEALRQNVDFSKDASLGYPASKLDGKVFYDDAPFLKDAPVLMTYVANPNHIGCHTTGTSETAFKGTQEIERETLDILAIDIFGSAKKEYDGYIASGGTEANIQALWLYRNYFMKSFGANPSEIAIIASEDTHYSIAKGSNLLLIDWINVPVAFENRKIDTVAFENLLIEAISKGKKYFIVVCNMGTTMFGSVDNPTDYTTILEKHNLDYKLHIDAAYGGFVYPFLSQETTLSFRNPKVSSITVDAHKMLQAPYGTGIFLCRKGLIENVLTKEAEYVEGMDLTLSGSRSGANAVAVWMILATYGPNGWFEKVKVLQMRTDWLCQQLTDLNIPYFREPNMNIVTIKSSYIPEELAHQFDLVPQKHNADNEWYKIVLMEHVEVDHLSLFLEKLKNSMAIHS